MRSQALICRLAVSLSKRGVAKKECEKSACLIVKYYGKGYEDEVIRKIEKAGYDPEDYQIIYERRAQ